MTMWEHFKGEYTRGRDIMRHTFLNVYLAESMVYVWIVIVYSDEIVATEMD